jgi:hypothetical protein
MPSSAARPFSANDSSVRKEPSMKKLQLLSLAAALTFLAASISVAEDEFPKPGPQQERLKQLAGDWNAKITCNFPGTDGPTESSGKQTAKMDIGGYFLVADFTGEFAGQPFKGHSITGYDPFQKKYTGVWVDSMGPALYNTVGEWDKAGKTYTEQMQGPGPDGKPIKFRSVTKITDDNHMQFTMSMVGEDDQEAKMMEIQYSRQK